MYSKILSGTPSGVNARIVGVEVDISSGLPTFNIVGSIGNEVRESRERVSVALKNLGFHMPAQRVTVNLSPADIRKDGTAFDLPIAVGILLSSDHINRNMTEDTIFIGELGLNGELGKVRGVLPIIRQAADEGIKKCIVPMANIMEAAVVPNIKTFGAENIVQVVEYLKSGDEGTLVHRQIDAQTLIFDENTDTENDFSQIIGKETAKRAAKIAAAGFHNLLMSGPPGAGKSMIAKCIPGIMPPLTLSESLELTSVMSVSGLLKEGDSLVTHRPFINPHHTISLPALIGGSTFPRPGAMSLAHRGVLFLDELPEFGTRLLDAMRQPLEDRKVNIARVHGNITYPADCMLVAAMNPCPCGYYPNTDRCRCSDTQVRKYMGRISGPILDRIDLCVELEQVEMNSIKSTYRGESSMEMRSDVIRARRRQEERFKDSDYRFNADIMGKDIDKYCRLGNEEKKVMEQIYENLMLSARTYHRILKCARTIADLEDEDEIKSEHLLEAACYRPAKEYWR
jgi:magnesium chelatase family protein